MSEEEPDLPTLECKRCGHEWTPKEPKKPKECPECESPYWDREKESKNTSWKDQGMRGKENKRMD